MCVTFFFGGLIARKFFMNDEIASKNSIHHQTHTILIKCVKFLMMRVLLQRFYVFDSHLLSYADYRIVWQHEKE